MLDAKLESLREINPWLEQKWNEYHLPDCRRFDISLCLYEVVANIIMYAFDQPVGHQIEVALKVRESIVEITVKDDGRPFNPLAHPEQPSPLSIGEAPIGGYGITLIRSLSDRLDYERSQYNNIFIITNFLVPITQLCNYQHQ